VTIPGRWDRLFADLEAEAEAQDRAALSAEVTDRTRAESARIHLVDRLRAARGHTLTCHLLGGATVTGPLREVGPDWFLVAESARGEALVVLEAVTSVVGLGAQAVAETGPVGARLDLRYALRRLARTRAAVTVLLTDGGLVTGTVDRVGADYAEVAEHPAGEARRAHAVRQVRTVPIRAVAVVRPTW
jgi:hypothetical protein